jgi:class 3 adenylate cyclase
MPRPSDTLGGAVYMAEERLQRRLAAILSADVVGFSRLMGIDEAGLSHV